jgi:hypothetical protein
MNETMSAVMMTSVICLCACLGATQGAFIQRALVAGSTVGLSADTSRGEPMPPGARIVGRFGGGCSVVDVLITPFYSECRFGSFVNELSRLPIRESVNDKSTNLLRIL